MFVLKKKTPPQSYNISKSKLAFIFILIVCILLYIDFKLLPDRIAIIPSTLLYYKSRDSQPTNNSLSYETRTTEKAMVERDYVEEGSKHVLNVPSPPFILGSVPGGPKYLQNSSCALFPHIFKIKFDNTIWQTQKISNWTFYLFSAFWDIRTIDVSDGAPSIQILGMLDRRNENITTHYCQIWFENKTEPLISEISHYRYIWNKKWGNYVDGELQPYFMNCLMPKNYTGQIPTSVSLVGSPCMHATNNLRILFDKPERKEMFAVCVKGLDFITPDWSIRLVEWIEMLHLLGVSKIYMYDLAVHPNVRKLYKYYKELNKIEVFPLAHPGSVPNDPFLRHAYLKRMITVKRQHELIPYNDCLYRNMYRYNYISLLDIDEIIIPHRGMSSWSELAALLENKTTHHNSSNFIFENILFTGTDEKYPKKDRQNIPDYLYMLQHTTRQSKEISQGSGVKCFLRPENILTMHNHWPTSCVINCTKVFVNRTDGFLHHYRTRDAGGIITKANQTITYLLDETIWKWKDELISRCNKALLDLGLIP